MQVIDTIQKHLDSLSEIGELTDTEVAHDLADEVLCNLLIELGYETVVDKWLEIDKYYA